MSVKLWAIQPGPVSKSEIVERAARLCYRSKMSRTMDERMAFLGKLAKRGHLSVFEHARYVRLYNTNLSNPYETFWSARYGTNITYKEATHPSFNFFKVSANARNRLEIESENPLFSTYWDVWCLDYVGLTNAEKLAHASATFEICGISRACSHQAVRHRVNIPSQESQRYVAAVNWEPVIPPSIATHPDNEVRHIFYGHMGRAKGVYEELREYGIPKEDARYVLPNATPTRIVITATFEHWRLFLGQRLPIAAQWEIRKEVAQKIHAELMAVEPELFGDLG